MDISNNLLDLFNHYFEVIHADTPEKLRECYRLRFEVYYKEGLFPGMNTDDYPNELECDEYDERSMHYLLVHKPTRTIAGTVRVIPTDRENPNKKLPLEIVAGDLFFQNATAYNEIQRSQLGEISRLVLTLGFRTRKGENRQPYGGILNDPDDHFKKSEQHQFQNIDQHKNEQRRIFPHAVIGLFVAIVQMSVKLNLIYWYCNMDPALARFLRAFGITFKPISPVIDYHGPRQGYLGCIPDIMDNIHRTNESLWRLLTENGALFSKPK